MAVALPIDAVVGRREDVVDLSERGDGLVEVEAERGEVVDRGLRDSPPRSNGDDSEAVREAPLPRVVGRGRCDPGEDGRVWAWGVGKLVSQRPYLSHFSRTLRPRLASSGKVNLMAVTVRVARSTRNAPGRRRVAWSGTGDNSPKAKK